MLAAAGIVVVIAAITMDVTIRRVWESSLRDEIQRGLTARARLFANRVESDHKQSLQDLTSQEALAAGGGAPFIEPTAQVLADSEADAKSMENHRGRKEFMAALAGNIGVDERRSHTIGVPYLYVAVPVSGGAVRMAYQLSDVEAASQRIHRALLLGSLIAFVIIMLLAALAAHYTARRLQRILRFAEQVSAGDFAARISATSLDEIGQVATALDKTARRVEESFLAVQTSQRQLETLLNSMQDAVIAVGSDGRVQWANRGMERLVPQRTRLNAPVVETVRDPQFLAAVRDATEGKKIASARPGSLVPGPTFEVRPAPARPEAAPAPACATLPKPSASRKHAATSSPTSRTNCAPRSPPSRATPRPCSTAPARTDTSANFWKSSARTPPACRASPKICSRWRAWNPASSASIPSRPHPQNSSATPRRVSGKWCADKAWNSPSRPAWIRPSTPTARPSTRFYPI